MKTVKFLDVGHGDCSVIYFLEKGEIAATVIIDIPQSEKLLLELKNNHVRKIDYLIISHSDSDHCRGVSGFLDDFLKYGIVKRIVFNYDKRKTTRTQSIMLRKMLEVSTKFQVGLVLGTISDSKEKEKKLIQLDNEVLSIIYPNTEDEISPYLTDNTNNYSIVCYLRGDKSSVIFSGDLEAEGWKRLLGRNPSLRCDVLKMPHHGAYWNKESSIDDIIMHLAPKEAIVSSGNNKLYKHPHVETIRCLKRNNIKIYCTQCTEICNPMSDNIFACNGDIQIKENKQQYTIETSTHNKMCMATPQCM